MTTERPRHTRVSIAFPPLTDPPGRAILPPMMSVKRNTPDQLIVADIPWVMGVLLIAFILIFVGVGLSLVISGEWMGLMFVVLGGGIGAIAFVAFVRRVQMIFDRPTDRIIHRRRSVFGYSEDIHPLSELKGVTLETSYSRKGGTMYRPTLLLNGDRVPIVQSYTNTRGPKKLADAIEAWIALAEPPDNRT